MTDQRAALWIALIIGAPWALVLVVALLRGYSIDVKIRRSRRSERQEDEQD